MFPSDLLTTQKKFMYLYESYCIPVCKKYQLNQSDLDMILFLSNNPSYNTARDVCEIRGMKKGIVSVTTERLVKQGYLIRENDSADRRIQRLYLTKRCQEIVTEGKQMQRHFLEAITSELTEEEMLLYQKISDKIRTQIIKLEKEL